PRHRGGHRHRSDQATDQDRQRRAPRIRPKRHHLHQARHRVPHQRRGPRAQLHPLARHHRPLLRPRRPRRARRFPRLQRLHHPVALRLDDRQAHLLRLHPQDRPRTLLPRAQRIPHPRRQDHHPPAKSHHERSHVHGGQGHHRLHGGLLRPHPQRPVHLNNLPRKAPLHDERGFFSHGFHSSGTCHHPPPDL